MIIDFRHIETGHEIPSEGYCDQPYVVVNGDGSWTCVMTTGCGHEGQSGQHVVATISQDQGKTWSDLYDIEPANGPEASWVMPLRVPGTGRIYAFYTYNKSNQREVKTVHGTTYDRVDSFGVYAYKYSDDYGRTWSADRYEIPMRTFEIDRNNVYGGEVQFFWGVGKPFVHNGKAYVVASKVGGFGPGFFTSNEGVLFASNNLLTEHDPAKHAWETLPDGDVGLCTPEGGGPVAGEFNATPMNDGSLYGTYRTIDGYACHAYSRDDGHTWQSDWMTYTPGGRRVKNPRSANFVRRFANGKYLYWFCFNGGEVLRQAPGREGRAYNNRNPIWMCGGVERDGHIHWSQPEIILYDPKIGNRMSYPDYIEVGDRIFITETQKEVARTHELDSHMLAAMWDHLEINRVATDALVVDVDSDACAAGATVAIPKLPELYSRGTASLDPSTGATHWGEAKNIEMSGGFSLELWVRFDDLEPWQILFDSRDEQDHGLLVQLTDRGTVRLTIRSGAYDMPGSGTGNGTIECSLDCDRGLIQAGKLHQIMFIVDGGPKIITAMVDGVLCDGGAEREFGWARFHPNLKNPNGAPIALLATNLHGTLQRVRVYDRYLLSNEGLGNWHATEKEGVQ